jgi:hypothetical protein
MKRVGFEDKSPAHYRVGGSRRGRERPNGIRDAGFRDLHTEKNLMFARCTDFWAFRRVRLYHQPANFTFWLVAEEGREEMNLEECAR